MKTKLYLVILLVVGLSTYLSANPVNGLLERIDKGASKKFVIELNKGADDFFELDQKGSKVVVRGNNYVNIATGINWYLKYYAGIQLSWNGMQASLPVVLPPVTRKERHETSLSLRYDFNYCTYSYTMAFWDWERWEKEIDWMALHGINLPLAAVGQECIWFNMLQKLGYSKEEINSFILPDARYRALDAQYAKEQDALEIEIAELEKAITGYEQSQKSAEKFIALIDKYENFDTMTNTMLNEFVEKILVHERARKGSQDTTQEIEIYFNYLGRYIPPSLQPVPLTPEEQEELQKKEERKDRLHQNYLKRKASGAQKRYEDKIKAKKKAEMDAKKALIQIGRASCRERV